jgi:acetyl-CoA synthetase
MTKFDLVVQKYGLDFAAPIDDFRAIRTRRMRMGTMRMVQDYASAVARFDPQAALDELTGSGILNAANLCCDRHAQDAARVALRYRTARGESSEWTFAALRRESERLAALFASLGVGKGDRVAALLPRTPELLITMLATWRLGAVYLPLFTAFGPKAVGHRLGEAAARIVVTDAANRAKIDVDGIWVMSTQPGPGDLDFHGTPPVAVTLETVACALDDPFLILFTSGTTGAPKALLVPIRAIAAFMRYMLDGVGLTADDRFWNIADPGWAYGLYYSVVGPLALGFTTTFYDGPFSAESSYAVIRALGITNLAGSPTAFRLLMAAGAEMAAPIRGRLRVVSSAGEPLNPEIIRWFESHLGVSIRDHYGQTETGMVLCNHHGLAHPIRIGSAGFASPGHHVTVLADDRAADAGADPGADPSEAAPGVPGKLALDRTRSPLMWFGGYLGQETRAFVGDWYLTGDTCERGEDGSIAFVGRADDVITTSGYRVGPFDVESALLEHPAVLESGVVGKPDPDRTEIIKAFVVLNPGHAGDAALAEALQRHVKTRLSAHAYPREIEFVASLPKTPSGKVQRHLLRAPEQRIEP